MPGLKEFDSNDVKWACDKVSLIIGTTSEDAMPLVEFSKGNKEFH